MAEKRKTLASRLAHMPEVTMTKDQKEKQKAADKKAEQAEKEYQVDRFSSHLSIIFLRFLI